MGHFMIQLLLLTFEVYNLSLHYLISIGLHAGEILTESYGPNYTKFWPFWQILVNDFWQSVDAIFEDVSVTETIVLTKTDYSLNGLYPDHLLVTS